MTSSQGIHNRPGGIIREPGWQPRTSNILPLVSPAIRREVDDAFSLRFGAAKKTTAPKTPKEDKTPILDTLKIKLPKSVSDRLKKVAKDLDLSPDEPTALGQYIMYYLPHLMGEMPKKNILEGVTDTITGVHNGKKVHTEVKTLMGAKQIFDEWLGILNKTENYAQIALYDFDNVEVDGGRAVDGADRAPGWKEQQQILKTIVEKARKGVRFQILLDNSVEYKQDEFGRPVHPRKLNNQGMIEYLRRLKDEEKLPIDVVPYPRKLASIYHVKLLISDGKRAIAGGMNLSNHSAANWDACVSLEGAEVANIQQTTFYPDWLISRHYENPENTYKDILKELPTIEAVSDPAIKVLNTMPREYSLTNFKHSGLQSSEGIGDYIKTKLDSDGLSDVFSEQFIATHKEIKEKLIDLNQNKKVNLKMLHSSSVVDQFPYCRKTVFDLLRQNVPLRYYHEWEGIQERLHAKWTVFVNKVAKKPSYEVLIGSANLSAAALETNVKSGQRPDYPNNPKQKYTRGNRDMAIVIPSEGIGKAFSQQFKNDWDYSPPIFSKGVGQHEKAANAGQIFKQVQDKLSELLGLTNLTGQEGSK